MEHKLDSHVSSVDQRLARVNARLDEIEVRQSSNSFSSSTNVHAAPHTIPLRGSVTTPATPIRPRAGMSSAEGDWNSFSLEERSAWRLRNAGLATHSSPLQESRPSADVDPDSSFLSKPLYCKPELLPKFNGQPAKLEEWIDRVGDLVRMNRDPRWDSAVVAVIATAFTGPAARWHATLSSETVDKHRSVADIFRVMRKAFPINRGQSMLRTAYALVSSGPQEEIELAEIVDGLPDTMKPMIRLPPGYSNMDDLVHELCQWEYVWRKIHKIFLVDEDTSQSSAELKTSDSGGRTSFSSRPKPAAPPQVATEGRHPTASTPSAPPRYRYDPSKVVESQGAEPRKYLRENGPPMRLNRPCGRCGEQHFDFEHAFLKEGSRAFPLVPVADYEVDTADDDGSDF
ncbi:unnamed protein product [Tilletia controversa]|uniref:Uncharacterized protein n=1 Tax=Tilletia controversa TaxID=13291 RepID=A0A8X7MQY1_9BASI|nr:hypothetical protein A4X06_0g5875 [Tilletia controversa]CAD6981341.1 unnamed protein product [Tilletia controversa]